MTVVQVGHVGMGVRRWRVRVVMPVTVRLDALARMIVVVVPVVVAVLVRVGHRLVGVRVFVA